MLESLGQILATYISLLGYPAIFLLMTAESALIPIPSEVTMPFSGFLVGRGLLNFWFVVAIGTFGNLTGSLLTYWLGCWGSDKGVRNLIKKYGKFLLITVDEYDTAVNWFDRHGPVIAFGSRCLPVVRTFISLPAGVAKMDLKTFAIFTMAGSFIWSTILAFLGFKLGENWPVLGKYFHQFDVLIIGIAVLFALLYVSHKIKKLRSLKS